MPLRGLGYLGVNSPDLAPWRGFASELIGLAPVATSATQLRFRMDVRAWRVAVHRAARPGLAYAGWEAADRHGVDTAMPAARSRAATSSTPCRSAASQPA